MATPKEYGQQSVIPTITTRDAKATLDLYTKALGGVEVHERILAEDGQRIMHSEIKVGSSVIFIYDEFPEWGGGKAPEGKSQGVEFYVYVDNVDKAYERAVQHGMTSEMPPEDMFWGDRICALRDPFGFGWKLATRVQKK